MLALGVDQAVIGERHPLPALVAVHRVVAAADRGDLDVAAAFDGGQEVADEALGRARRGVAAVEQGMDADRDAGGGEQPRESRQLALMRMYPAGRHQPHEVAGAAAALEGRDEIAKRRHLADMIAGEGGVDPRQVLHHHPAGAEIHVADLGIAHLARGQPDMPLRGVGDAVRRGPHQPIPDRLPGERDGIVGTTAGAAPAIEDAQQDRARPWRRRDRQDGSSGAGKPRSATPLALSSHDGKMGRNCGAASG